MIWLTDIYILYKIKKKYKAMKCILTEVFNIKNAELTARDGHKYMVAYIDPASSENTYKFKDIFPKYKAKFLPNKAWGWFLGQNPEYVYNEYIKPCLEELTKVEDEGHGTRQNSVIDIIDQLLSEINNNSVQSVEVMNTRQIKDALIQFKADLINCVSSEEFKKKIQPIINFKKQQGHMVSWRNAILIILQDPKATLVKSKTAWFNMNRSVKPNAKAITLFRPDKMPLSKEEKDAIRDKFLSDKGVKSVKELSYGDREILNVKLNNGQFENNSEKKFTTYNAYDIRFTQQIPGKEEVDFGDRVDLKWHDDSTEEFEQVERLVKATVKVVEESGVKIEYVPKEMLGQALGVSTSGKIKLPSESKYTQDTLDSLFHEFFHEMLHQKFLQTSNKNPEFSKFFVGKKSRDIIEQQAELASYITCSYYGFQREYSLNYVAMYGGLENAKTAAQLFDMVSDVSSFLIKKINYYMQQEEDADNGQHT